MFSLFTEEVAISCVTENRDVSSENNFALEDRSPDKSYIYQKAEWSQNGTLTNVCGDISLFCTPQKN